MILNPGKSILLIIIAVVFLQCGCATRKRFPASADGVQLTLPDALRSPKLEFSSMCWYGEQLLLIPQRPEKFSNGIFAINETDIAKAINSHVPIPAAKSISLVNFQQIKSIIGETYEGIEATAIAGSRIFFSVETKPVNPDCYLFGGTIKGDSIVLDPGRLVPLPKAKRMSNAGYESMAYSKEKNRLLLFFEYNRADIMPKVILADTSLTKPVTSLKLNPLFYRLTDVTAAGNGRLMGINFHYNGKKEYGEYIGDDIPAPEADMEGKTLKESCYSRIIELDVGKTEVSWKRIRKISLECDNWEGLTKYGNGVLIITDEYPGTVLKWLRLQSGD